MLSIFSVAMVGLHTLHARHAFPPRMTADPTGFTRRDVGRLALLATWAVGASSAVNNLLDFPPAPFRSLAKEVYLEAQSAAALGASTRKLRVLEIGAGLGLSSVFEDRFVADSEVLALDVASPDPARYRAAQARAVDRGYDLKFIQGDATELSSLADSSVDCVCCSLTLCSVASCEAAVSEVRRVLRPGGTFGYVEHVSVIDEDDRPLLALSQKLLDPLQQRVAHGCHLTRDSPSVIRDRFGSDKVLSAQRSVEASMWPVSQLAAGVVAR